MNENQCRISVFEEKDFLEASKMIIDLKKEVSERSFLFYPEQYDNDAFFNYYRAINMRTNHFHEVVNMVTNGLLLTEEKVRMLRASGVNGIQISLDSYSAEIHDKFRGLDGAFQKALEAIKLILNSGIIPEVTFIPTKLNYKGIGQVIDLLYELGIKKLNSMPFIPIGRGYDNRSRLKMTSQEKWEFEWLVRKKLNQYVDFDFNNGDPLEHIYLFSQNPNAKTITYEIRCNGDIVVSPYLPFLYGNAVKTSLNKLWDDGLKDVWKIPEIKDTVRRIISLEEIEKQTNRPWNNQDIQLYCERM